MGNKESTEERINFNFDNDKEGLQTYTRALLQGKSEPAQFYKQFSSGGSEDGIVASTNQNVEKLKQSLRRIRQLIKDTKEHSTSNQDPFPREYLKKTLELVLLLGSRYHDSSARQGLS